MLLGPLTGAHRLRGVPCTLSYLETPWDERKKGTGCPAPQSRRKPALSVSLVTIGRRRNLCVAVHETGWCRRECKILRREGATNRGRRIRNPRPTRSGHAATPLPATGGRPPPILFRSLWPKSRLALPCLRALRHLELASPAETLVRKEGFEPPRPFGHKILSLARLPVPPLPQWWLYSTSMGSAPPLGFWEVFSEGIASHANVLDSRHR